MADKAVIDSLKARMRALEETPGQGHDGFSQCESGQGQLVSDKQSDAHARCASDALACADSMSDASCHCLATDERAAFRKAASLLSVQDRSCLKLGQRLEQAGFSREAALAAVEHARSCGLADDARFADALVRSRVAQGKGAVGIAAELSRNGIDVSLVSGWPEEYLGEAEIDRACAVLDRRPPRAKNKRAAAYGMLMRKGYGSDVAASAARLWCEARESGALLS